MKECWETCNVGVPCPHGLNCDHTASGRLKYRLKNSNDMPNAQIIYDYDDRNNYDRTGCLILVDGELRDELNTCVNDHTGCMWNNGSNGCAIMLKEILYE